MSEDIYKRLTKPFDSAAYSPLQRGNKTLTSIKAQYVIERLNEVFGLGGWRFDGEWKDVDDGVLYFGELSYTLLNGPHAGTNNNVYTTGVISGFASADDHSNIGDAYKSARTDALTKAASLLGVGNDVFKGLVNLDQKESNQKANTVNNSKDEEVTNETTVKTQPATRFAKPATKEEASETESIPAAPKLKASRMFRRPTSKLNSSET